MKQVSDHHVLDLIDRIARIRAADEWTDDLNPAQWAALSYLAKANRFSRAPSQVADYMQATRGTVSQTLKALSRKGLIEETRSEADRRWVSYGLTSAGTELLEKTATRRSLPTTLQPDEIENLTTLLETLVKDALIARGRKPFGLCSTCRYHQKSKSGGYCILLEETLTTVETQQICFEHQSAA